jgi:hypothetical protein
MDSLVSFFALRPIFTFWGLKIVWYIYLLHTLVQLYISISGVAALMAQRGIGWLTWLPNLFPLLLGIIAQIAIVRLLLEVAATILLAPRRSEV